MIHEHNLDIKLIRFVMYAKNFNKIYIMRNFQIYIRIKSDNIKYRYRRIRSDIYG
jgi:hypothetical protein